MKMSILSSKTYGMDSDVNLKGSYDIEYDGLATIKMESALEQLEILESLYELDMVEIAQQKKTKALESAGADYEELESVIESFEPVMEGKLRNIWDKFVKFLKDLKNKLKMYLDTAIAFFRSFYMKTKDFVNKYKSTVEAREKKGLLKDMKIKTFDYDHKELEGDDVKNVFKNVHSFISKHDYDQNKDVDALTRQSEDMKENKESLIEVMRGKIIGFPSLSDSEFKIQLFRKFRKGNPTDSADKMEMELRAADVIKALLDEKAPKVIADAKKDMEKAFDDEIKELEKLAAFFEKGDKAELSFKSNKKEVNAKEETHSDKRSVIISIVRTRMSLFSAGKSIGGELVAAWKTAVNERSSAYKSFIIKALHYTYKNK